MTRSRGAEAEIASTVACKGANCAAMFLHNAAASPPSGATRKKRAGGDCGFTTFGEVANVIAAMAVSIDTRHSSLDSSRCVDIEAEPFIHRRPVDSVCVVEFSDLQSHQGLSCARPDLRSSLYRQVQCALQCGYFRAC